MNTDQYSLLRINNIILKIVNHEQYLNTKYQKYNWWKKWRQHIGVGHNHKKQDN